MTAYLLSLVALAMMACITGLALNIQWGMAGLVNFGLFGFYMIGAYACALLTTQLGWSPWLAMPVTVILTVAISALVCLISVRLADDYFAIVTLAFAESVKLLINNEEWLTRGSIGIPNIPRPVASDTGLLILAAVMLLVVF